MMLGFPCPCRLRRIRSACSSSENSLHIFSCPKRSFSCASLTVKNWYTRPRLSVQPFFAERCIRRAAGHRAFWRRWKPACIFPLWTKPWGLCRRHSFPLRIIWNTDSETHLLSVTVLNRDFICSGITVFLMAFSLEKSLAFCGFAASKSVT